MYVNRRHEFPNFGVSFISSPYSCTASELLTWRSDEQAVVLHQTWKKPISSSTMSKTHMRDIDPLLKDLSEKKQSFRRNVASFAEEFKEVRSRLALKEQTYATDILTRKEIEAKVKSMAEEITRLHKCLEERNGQLDASTSAAEKYLVELGNLKSQLTLTQATAEASAASAESAQLQCITLQKDLDEKNNSLQEHKDRLKRMEEQLKNLQNDLDTRDFTYKHLNEEVLRVEHEIKQALANAEANTESELRKMLDEVSSKNLEKMNKLLMSKDEEITRLKDEIKILSAHWRIKTKELESQLQKHKKADQDLKKRVLKLELCFQEARSQARKLQRIDERRERAIKELRDHQIAMTPHQGTTSESGKKPNFWDRSRFKVLVSMSMLIIVVFSKRK